MQLVSTWLYPFAMLLPAAGLTGASKEEARREEGRLSVAWLAHSDRDSADRMRLWPSFVDAEHDAEWPLGVGSVWEAEPLDAQQMRIERRVIIRVIPQPAGRVPDMLDAPMPRDAQPRPRPQVIERKIGNCVPAGGIRAVRPERDNRLALLMHDSRVLEVELEHACRSQDFYSGFLLERHDDGQMCVGRDKLLSRSGGHCKITQVRELVRRAP